MKKKFFKFSLLTLFGVMSVTMYSCSKSMENFQSAFSELIDEDSDENVRKTNNEDISNVLSSGGNDENTIDDVVVNQEDQDDKDDNQENNPVDPEPEPEPEPGIEPEPEPEDGQNDPQVNPENPDDEKEEEEVEEQPTLYTLTFVVDGIEFTSELAEGSQINYPENPQKQDYHFVGWDKEIDVMPNENVVITALFKEVVHGGFNYTNSQGEEVGYTWQDLIDNEYVNVIENDNGEVRLEGIDLSSFGDFDGTLVIDDSVTYIYSLSMSKNVEKVVIPDSVTAVEWNVFYGCTSLKEVEFGKGLTSFPKYMFQGCTSLQNFEIPSWITSIGEHCFMYCTSLTSMVIPESVESLGKGAFYGCSALENIRFDSDITTIEQQTFYNCTSLTSFESKLPLTVIGQLAFYNCYKLDPNSIIGEVVTCDKYAFDFDPELYTRNIDAYVIPSTATNFSGIAFGAERSEKFKRPMYYEGTIDNLLRYPSAIGTNEPLFYLSSEVRILDENGQYEYKGKKYSKITKIEIPRDITSIGRKVLSYLGDVTDIYVHKDFKAFGGNVFYNLDTASVKVHYEGTAEEWANVVLKEKSGKTTLGNTQMDLNNVEFNAILNY